MFIEVRGDWYYGHGSMNGDTYVIYCWRKDWSFTDAWIVPWVGY